MEDAPGQSAVSMDVEEKHPVTRKTEPLHNQDDDEGQGQGQGDDEIYGTPGAIIGAAQEDKAPPSQSRRSSRPSRPRRGGDDDDLVPRVAPATAPLRALQLQSNVKHALFPDGIQAKLEELGAEAVLPPRDLLDKLGSLESPTPVPPTTPTCAHSSALVLDAQVHAPLLKSLAEMRPDRAHQSFIRLASTLASVDSALPINGLDFAKLPIAVIKSWHECLRRRNFCWDAAFGLFDEGERLVLLECAADLLRGVDKTSTRTVNASNHHEKELSLLTSTARGLLNFGMSVVTRDVMLQPADENLAVRRIWLFLVQIVLDPVWESDRALLGKEIAGLIDFLGPWLAKHGPLRLHHMHHWEDIDAKHLSLLTAFLQDSCYFSTLEKTHAMSPAWLAAVRSNMEQNSDLTGMVTMSVKKKQRPEDSLLLLIFETCQALGDYETWLLVASKVFRAFSLFFVIIHRGSEDGDDILAWTVHAMGCIQKTLERKPNSPPAAAGHGNSDEHLEATNDVLLKLQLNAFVHDRDDVLAAAGGLLLTLASSLGVAPQVVRAMVDVCVSCVDDLTEAANDKPREMVKAVSKFASNLLVTVDAFSSKFLTENKLVTVAASFSMLVGRWAALAPSINLSSNSVLLSCCFALPQVTPSDKLTLTTCFVENACAEPQRTVGAEGVLRHVASVLQQVVNSDDGCPAFSKRELSHKELNEFCTSLGSLYFLLYGVPLVVPVSSSQEASLGLNLDGERIGERSVLDDVYRFYEFCVAFGHCGKLEKRACLAMLTQLPAMEAGPAQTENFQRISHFLFGTNQEAYPADDDLESVQRLLADLQAPGGSRSDHPMDAHSSIFFELLCQIRDGFGVRERELRDGFSLLQSSSLTLGEKRLCQAIDLCVKDLVFSPRRYESWATLHAKLIEYLQVLSDDLSGRCIPDFLPQWLHEDFGSASFTMADLMNGDLRNDVDRGALLLEYLEGEARIRALEAQQPSTSAVEIFGRAFVAKPDRGSTVAKLCLLLDFKNCFIKAVQRIGVLLNSPSMLVGAPLKDRMQALLNHGIALSTLSHDFPLDSCKHREVLSAALTSFERCHALSAEAPTPRQGLHTGSIIYVMCKIARLRWLLYGDLRAVAAIFRAVRDMLKEDKSRNLWRLLRIKVLNEVSEVVGEAALRLLLSSSVEPESAAALSADLLEASRMLAHFQEVGPLSKAADDGDAAAASQRPTADIAWEIVLHCLTNCRACQRWDPYDFRSVYCVAHLLHCLQGLPETPAWVLAKLGPLGLADGATNRSALREISKLFNKKRAQIAAMWFPEKPSDEWDFVIGRTNEFDHLRRRYVGLYTRLLVLGDDLPAALNLLHSVMFSQRQTAALVWMLEVAIFAALAIVGKRLDKYQRELRTLYEILQLVHARVSVPVCRKINAVLCALYGKAAHIKQPSLGDALHYCHAKWGVANSVAPQFHKRGATSLGKRASGGPGNDIPNQTSVN